MTKPNEKKFINKEPWYQELEERLADYKELKSRVKVLYIQLHRDILPDAKLIATYGESFGGSHEPEVDPKEIELLDKEQEIKLIDAALEGLKEDAKKIIMLRYIEGVKDWHIYEIKIPMSKSLYYEIRNNSVEQIARTLGIITENGQFVDNGRNKLAI